MGVNKKSPAKRRPAKRASSKKTVRRKKTSAKPQGLTFESEVALWILLAVSILLFISNFGVGGKIGNWASSLMFGLFGLMAYIFPVLMFIGLCFLISNKRNHLDRKSVV